MKVLVTGGAGYIGAHVIRALRNAGHAVAVLDDFSTGSRGRLYAGIPLYVGSLLDDGFVASTLSALAPEAVVHVAAKKAVEQSVTDPLFYYRENVIGTHSLLSGMVATGTTHILFSSSAAVYGADSTSPVTEAAPTAPSSPYGWTKLLCEKMIRDVAAAHQIKWSALRYFNVAGAAERKLADRSGENLIPRVFRAITSGQRPTIYGNTHSTPDGTCIRDYVHVKDVADAHVAALEALTTKEIANVYNIGTGTGTSVLEVIDAVRKATGIEFPCEVAPPRPGDPAELVADPAMIHDGLGWKAHYDLATIVESAWRGWSATVA